MRKRYSMTTLTLVLLVMFAATDAGAQFYAIDNYSGLVYSYDDTVGTVANPDTVFPSWVRAASLDHAGRLLLAMQDDGYSVARFDIDAQTVVLLDTLYQGHTALEVVPGLGDDIYVLIAEGGWMRGDPDGSRQSQSYLSVLRGGVAPLETVFGFDNGYAIDMVVRPTGPRAGNLLVLIDDDGSYIIEIERTETDSFAFYGYIANGGMMPSAPNALAVDPNGMIIVLDYFDGLYYVDEEYGYVWGFGGAVGPGLVGLEIGADGTIYVGNSNLDRIERYDSAGYQMGLPFGADITYLGPIAAAGYTPTPEGEDVLIEPGKNIEVTYESVTSSGFTTAVIETTVNRVSPEGNYLPADAQFPGSGRSSLFKYIGLSTDAVYEGLIQVDVIEEGSRLFYASGVGDTFRDFTVTGSIEDARGTIPRFSDLPTATKRVETGPTEVVLVEDERTLPEVTAYKFWRLELAMDVPDNMPGGDPCPWEFIQWLQKYHASASDYYRAGQYGSALSELAVMNGLIRSHAGWCIPDSSDDPLGNMVAHLLAHSKTLMYSIELESGGILSGIDDANASISLAVTSPARGECRLTLLGPVGTEVAARIYNVSGRLVATVYEGRLPEGGETIVWNGIDDTGRPIASGVYFARVESDSDVLTSKVVFIR
jgi:hypothetical protein